MSQSTTERIRQQLAVTLHDSFEGLNDHTFCVQGYEVYK